MMLLLTGVACQMGQTCWLRNRRLGWNSISTTLTTLFHAPMLTNQFGINFSNFVKKKTIFIIGYYADKLVFTKENLISAEG